MKWAIATIATVVIAVTLARRSMAAQLPAQPGGVTVENAPPDPYDQLPNFFETAIVNITPSTYIPPSTSIDTRAANVRAFLDMIAFAEGTAGRDGYRMLFGGSLFDSFDDHPRVYIPFRDTTTSAAGRYQILWRTWAVLKQRLGLPDFSPASQDAAAIELIRERGALRDAEAGRVQAAVAKVAPIWASLPGAGYNQPERKLSQLVAAFTGAGGTIEA